MSSTIHFTCDLTGKRGRAPTVDDAGIEIRERDDDEYLPEGWGTFEFTRVIPNPAYAERSAQRDEAAREIQKAAEAGDDTAKAALGDLNAFLDQHLPLPEQLAVAVIRWNHLSPEAVESIRDALVKAGVVKEGE